MPTMKELGLDKLTDDERRALANELYDSVAPAGLTLTDAKRAELDRRLAALAAAPDDVVPWEQVHAAAVARYSR